MSEATLFIVDDDAAVREALAALLETEGFQVETYPSAEALLATYYSGRRGCLLLDVRMPGMDGLELQARLSELDAGLPIIIMTGDGDVPLAVKAMKAGAKDFLEKPVNRDILLESLARALEAGKTNEGQRQLARQAAVALASLTPREREVLDGVVRGEPNKVIGHALGISPRTVEIYRSRAMDKMRAGSLAELVRMALAAGIRP